MLVHERQFPTLSQDKRKEKILVVILNEIFFFITTPLGAFSQSRVEKERENFVIKLKPCFFI